MGLTKYKLGSLIELAGDRNTDGFYGIDDVRGINNLKEMMKSKADLNGRDLTKFQIVYPGEFVFNHRTSRNGSKFSITYNYDAVPHIFTEDYVVFHIKQDCSEILLKEWLYLYFCRSEFDRFVITNSWGSSTEFYNWTDICDLDLSLPTIEQQKKFVNIYLALKNNLEAHQSKVDELKLVCDGYIEELRRRLPCEAIGHYIRQKKGKNTDKQITDVWGVSTTRQFIEASSAVDKNNLSNYKIVDCGDIAYVPTTHLKVYAIALSDKKNPFVVSPIYEVFAVKDKDRLDPEYLYLWLCRDETMRYAFYNSWGSARENFNFDDMCTIRIPIPSIEIQRDIVNIHRCYIERQRIATKLKEYIISLCPILIKGSLQTNI